MMTHHTLVTLLGKGRENPRTGYRKATYRFPDGAERQTAFFGLALGGHLQADTLVILGTRGSQWGVLVEHLATGEIDAAQQHAIDELYDAEAESHVDQTMLDGLAPLMTDAVGCRRVIPRLIPFGRDAREQYDILQDVADVVPNGAVSIDLTHGFRHLGVIGFLSAAMLERLRSLDVRGLWYGALDMQQDGVAPVLRLDGVTRVRRWTDALDRFDATGDYGVFAPLLEADGVRGDRADCLRAAAFHERAFNVQDAVRKLRTFLPALVAPLAGASGLFRQRLKERLRWVGAGDLAAQQRDLAFLYLERRHFVRAAIFGWEALITRACLARGLPPDRFDKGRKRAGDDLDADVGLGRHPAPDAYRTLKHLRNALAHGNPPPNPYRNILQDPARLHGELQTVLQRLFEA